MVLYCHKLVGSWSRPICSIKRVYLAVIQARWLAPFFVVSKLEPPTTHPPWFLVVLSICFLLVVRSNPGGTGLSRPFLSDPPISLGPQPISTNSKQFQISNEENYLKFSHLHHPTSISGLMVRLRSVPDNLEWKIKSWDFASSWRKLARRRIVTQIFREKIVTKTCTKNSSSAQKRSSAQNILQRA